MGGELLIAKDRNSLELTLVEKGISWRLYVHETVGTSSFPRLSWVMW